MFADKFQRFSDEALLAHYHTTRNFQAFRHLYQRHKDSLYRYCAQMNQQHAPQIVEQLWGLVLNQPPKLYGRLLHSWLFIQANKILQRNSFTRAEDGEGVDLARQKACQSEAGLAENSNEVQFLLALQQLPRIQRNIFLLHTECRLSLATAADIEKISLRQCRDHYHNSKQAMEQHLYGVRRPWRTRDAVDGEVEVTV